eukprot:CAMPEP_0174724198 /NCGR_PEP_ID=MMETSP1094-20130205/42782_1 /TAXON_ID=156173 /ORGANISM="Chrysochromulina brevifilum, Strain UTEX LB 985" /LENGTH=197 /DNA_ID=CAMNT_0015925377 /DNA_START=55 /DNA_END=648 /DNA_ORIENTATION=-
MMIAMGPSQLLQLKIEDGVVTQMPGRPDLPSLGLALAGLSVVAFFARLLSRRAAAPPHFMSVHAMSSAVDLALWAAAAAYFCTLILVMAFGKPDMVVAEGIHQTYGECGVHDVDLSNYSRYKYLCQDNFDEDFRFDCAPEQPLPPPTPSWFTLCGKPHSDHMTYLGAVAALSLAASITLAAMLGQSWAAPQKQSKRD